MDGVVLETNHGIYRLEARPGDDIRSVLARFQVPGAAVWTYVLEDHREVAERTGARRVRFVPTSTRVDSPDLDGRQVHARVTRNINLPGLLGFDAQAVRPIDHPVTEWVFPSPHAGAFHRVQAQLDAEECHDFVKRSVAETVREWPADLPRRLVVGTSGGGDSNVLLSALMGSGAFRPEDVLPVMMLGIPDWDTQLDNARQLCSAVGLELRIIEEPQAAELAGVTSLPALRDGFRDAYPDADLEFLGTWLLRKVLGGYAEAQGITAVATGANREDVIAEGLARISRGALPLPAPFRRIGPVTFVFPMFKVPKKIGDGAFPTFSLENYEARNPSFSPGRSVFYYLSYYLADLCPGFDVTLLDGFRALAAAGPDPFAYEPQLDDHAIAGAYDSEQLARWRAFLADHSRKQPADD